MYRIQAKSVRHHLTCVLKLYLNPISNFIHRRSHAIDPILLNDDTRHSAGIAIVTPKIHRCRTGIAHAIATDNEPLQTGLIGHYCNALYFDKLAVDHRNVFVRANTNGIHVCRSEREAFDDNVISPHFKHVGAVAVIIDAGPVCFGFCTNYQRLVRFTTATNSTRPAINSGVESHLIPAHWIWGLTGEPCRIRTGDPLLKRQMLYRLS